MKHTRGTLERSWTVLVDGYPIRVEEHRNDLAYIVEFYDGSEEVVGPCISHNPETGRLLIPEEIIEETMPSV